MNQDKEKQYRYLTVKEAVNEFNEKPNTIYQRIKRKTYTHIYKKDGKWYIREDDLNEYIVEKAESIEKRIKDSIPLDIKMVPVQEYMFHEKKSRQLIFYLISHMYSPIKINGKWHIDINEPLWDKRIKIEKRYINMLEKKYCSISDEKKQ